MELNSLFHGFRVKSVTDLPEIKAKMWRMEYEKNGADLVWFDREDLNANMTFGIAFKTLPDDDTGVFHIIEHSVLCGSDKYPVKEPFVDLIKSSVNTFLNALTYKDKTVYPVCSRSGKDFLNLMDVYLDAVLHPLSLRRPLAFLQEGWHYEFAEDGTPSFNGVVYSEMKGAYANPDRILFQNICRGLFPDNCYSRESGGHPDHVTELTYEKYCACLRKYYAASNARIFLDGPIDTEAVFEKLDSFLSEFERTDPDSVIPMQAPVAPPMIRGCYPVGEGEEAGSRDLYMEGRVFADFTEQEKVCAAGLLADVLCGSNEAPLTKAVLQSGLAEDIALYPDAGMQQIPMILRLKNLSGQKLPELLRLIDDTVASLIRDGLDREELEAVLNIREFAQREISDPLEGLSNGLDCLDTWLYGGDPADMFHDNEIYARLRQRITDGSGYYENLLREIFVDCTHKASCLLTPSAALSAETAAAETARAAAAAAAMSPAERRKAEDDLAELRRFQETEDAPEDTAKLPRLHLSDLNDAFPPSHASVGSVSGVPLLRNTQDTNGIIFCDMMFSLDDFDEEALHRAEFLRLMFSEVGTAKHTAQQILRIQKRDFGNVSGYLSTYRQNYPRTGYRSVFTFSFSALDTKLEKIAPTVQEIFLDSDYNAPEEIISHLRQNILQMEDEIKRRGHSYANRRAEAMLSAAGRVTEICKGITHLQWLKELLRRIEAEGADFAVTMLQETAARLFTRSRLRMSITGNASDAYLASLIAPLPAGEPLGPLAQIGTLPLCREGIEIPAQVGFAVSCGPVWDKYIPDGSDCVAGTVVSYGFLWNEIRVKGGAYGCGMLLAHSGSLLFHSYRDPQPGRSLEVYREAAAYLRQAADGDFENYVISTYGSALPLQTPRSESAQAVSLWMRDLPFDHYRSLSEQILATDAAALRRIADLTENAVSNAAVCVFGGAEKLKECKLDKITNI